MAFGRTLALDSVDLDLEPGLVGVFGPNGAGKSTLLRVIAGLEAPTRGTVTFVSFDGLDAEQLRGRIGYAGHSSGLYARLSLSENLALFSRLYGLRDGRSNEVIDRLALGEHARKPVRDLSAGLKRRATVARAILHEPAILLLDEPYANVDDDASESISAAVRDWWQPDRLGLVATHGAKKVRAYAHAGLVLQRGRAVRFGTYSSERFSPQEGVRPT